MGEKRSDHHDNKARETARKELELDITIPDYTEIVEATVGPQPPGCRKDVRKWMYEFSRMYADVRFFGGLGGFGPALFSAFACRGGAASTEIASWGAAGCPAIGAGRPDK